ncbi:MAG: Rieske 2Fe-2S domain-containing protein [Gemmataceae bacterium]|nr:Rieske 2Fe-2S domain-containing protein [Gemmataceae bacterium]
MNAPDADRFPECPTSWYLYCRSRDLGRRPLSRNLLGRRLVAFRTASGKIAIIDGRCAHLGADLGAGCVHGEAIQCAFHHWEYGTDGRCVLVPAKPQAAARFQLSAYPVVERHGFVFVFNGPEALFPLPFFPDADPGEFIASEPFDEVLLCPWWMVGANVFDVQHFRAAHDRKLIDTPAVDCPSPYARRITANFTVLGDTLRDRLVRRFAGERVRMTFTDWCGNIIFATPTFRRTASYGMLITEPLGPNRVHVHGIVFVPRSRSRMGQTLFDPMHAKVRRYFIKAFLHSDARLGTKGLTYNPAGLFDCDGELIRYFDWLASLPSAACGVTPRKKACGLVDTNLLYPQSS